MSSTLVGRRNLGGAFFPFKFSMAAAPDPSPLAALRTRLHGIQEKAELIAASLNAARAGREPTVVASVHSLEMLAESLMSEQIRLLLEIKVLERATSEPSVPSPPAPPPAGDSAPKRAKMLQSTLAGFVLLQKKDDPTIFSRLQGPKVIETTSPTCDGCGRSFKSLEGANERWKSRPARTKNGAHALRQ